MKLVITVGVELSGRVTCKSVLQIHSAIFPPRPQSLRTTDLEVRSFFRKPAQNVPGSPGGVSSVDFLAWDPSQQTGPQLSFSTKILLDCFGDWLLLAKQQNKLKGRTEFRD